jgi:hypothetical protein
MAEAFTIHIFVPDGDPDGIPLIDRMNWTGLGVVFPRAKWPEVKWRPEQTRIGIYILVGYPDEDDELLTLYIGPFLLPHGNAALGQRASGTALNPICRTRI